MIPTVFLTLLGTATLATATISYNSTLTHPGDDEPWFDGSIPATSISESCGSAYAQDLPCDEWLLNAFNHESSEEEKFNNSTLKALCTDTCILGLQKWRDDVRKSCTDKDVGRKASIGQQTIASLIDTKIMFVQYLYWPTCMKDLKKGTLCYADGSNGMYTASSDDTENTPEVIDAFCKNNCQTQASVFTWVVGETVFNDTADINIADARKICKGLDTSGYPFLKDSSATGGSSSSSSSSGAVGAANSTGGNGTEADTKNDGVRVGGSVGLLTTLVLGAVMVGLGSL
ncbi:unnamed protein product [Tuber melanosporum]|jgi:hypothetical protein|uniref:(Perigord truffle) hypothetical protein n=1 Tax=Tuber melanosporum (strain Mel28) TaxID=656061 RepID=D5GA18_TUBMM|nr:uncharacterized protein GSTUM_00003499001 [Tuber melanosporum]CAZ81361.1 unnamed protein product [Tuber melanosporum]